jgi:hypothetical protein
MFANARGETTAMPKQCQLGKTSPASFAVRWKPDATVNVYFLKNSFTDAEIAALSRSVKNWNNALSEMDARVLFRLAGESESVVKESASVTLLRGIPRGAERLGEIRFHLMPKNSLRVDVTISPAVTDLNALTSLLTHELGHSLGLADCYECRRGTTAMSAFRGSNKGNDVYEPSACDKYVVAAGYAAAQLTAQATLAK